MSETCLKRKLSYVLKNINADLKNDTQKSVSTNAGTEQEIEYEETKFTLHQLRHTYACILYKAGIDIKQAQLWMGHKDIKMTTELYVHNEVDELKKAIQQAQTAQYKKS